jgi:hypothetical protein
MQSLMHVTAAHSALSQRRYHNHRTSPEDWKEARLDFAVEIVAVTP